MESAQSRRGDGDTPRLRRPCFRNSNRLPPSAVQQREVVMTLKRTAFLAFVAGLFVSQGAFAADLGGAPRRGMKDEPLAYSPPPQFSWTGLYVGAHVGYGWSDLDWQFDGDARDLDRPHRQRRPARRPDRLQRAGQAVRIRRRGRHVGRLDRWRHRVPERGLRLQPHLQLAGLAARPRRHRRQRQPHAALRHGGRRLGRRRPPGNRRRDRRPRSAPASTSVTGAGSPAAASSTC